jgi:hypothetical protein
MAQDGRAFSFVLPRWLEIRNGSHSSQGTMKGDGTGDQAAAPIGGVRRVEGTNVLRVPFGVRRARRARPERPDHWATLVIPFHGGGGGPTPPQAA